MHAVVVFAVSAVFFWSQRPDFACAKVDDSQLAKKKADGFSICKANCMSLILELCFCFAVCFFTAQWLQAFSMAAVIKLV
jgi:hypothetical protein